MTALPVILTEGFIPQVRVNEHVVVGQTIAKKKSKTEEVVNVAEELDMPLNKVKHVLKKNPGDSVISGEIIALKQKWFGLKKWAIFSAIEGIVLRYERGTGNLVIRTMQSNAAETIESPIEGIISQSDSEKIVIETDKNVLSGKRGYGDSTQGEVFLLNAALGKDAPDPSNLVYAIDGQVHDKIIVGGVFSRDMLIKGLGVGAKGFIGTEFEDDDVSYMAKKSITTPVIEVDDDIIAFLIQWKGKNVFLEPQSNSIVLLQG